MGKTNVKVYIRTRPTASNYDGLKVLPDGCSVVVKVPKVDQGQKAPGPNNQQDAFAFKYDGVLEGATQEYLYTTVAHDVLETFLAGYSGCILCYGQTAAGKTFTMAGDLRNYVHRGIIPRALHHLFREIDVRVDKLFKVHVSYLEIYNEQLYDLLADNPGATEELAVQEDPIQGAVVRGLTRVHVKSEEDALAQYFLGEQGRSTSRHVMNEQSSRSHCVYTIYLEIRNSEAAAERAVLAKLHLVDLAGSERTKKTNATGQTLKEAQCINKSLSFLEQTVSAMARREAHVPFRQSKLTSMLRDALGGNSKTVMVGNIWGEPEHIEETISTLRFAARMRTLTTELSLAESNDPGLLVRRFERQIKELKQELAMRDTLGGKGRINYDDPTESELRELNQVAKRFLQGEVEVEELPIDSIKRIKECYRQMRAVYASAVADMEAQITTAHTTMKRHASQRTPEGNGSKADMDGIVGDVDDSSKGFQVGTAPRGAQPSSISVVGGGPSAAGGPGSTASPRPATNASALHQIDGASSPQSMSSPEHMELPIGETVRDLHSSVARNNAFLFFKRETAEGKAASALVKERTAEQRSFSVSIKETGSQVNAAKVQIDELNAMLDNKKAESPSAARTGPSGEPELDTEHYKLVQELKKAKLQYRTHFDSLKQMRTTLEQLVSGVAEAKRDLIARFDTWLASAPAATVAKAKGGFQREDEEDELDAGEAFELVQLSAVSATDPDSVPYYAARHRTTNAQSLRTSGAFRGAKAAADEARKRERDARINAGYVR